MKARTNGETREKSTTNKLIKVVYVYCVKLNKQQGAIISML